MKATTSILLKLTSVKKEAAYIQTIIHNIAQFIKLQSILDKQRRNNEEMKKNEKKTYFLSERKLFFTIKERQHKITR